MIARALAVLAAGALAWLGLAHLDANGRCDRARSGAQRLPASASRAEADRLAAAAIDACRGSHDLALAARGLTRSGHVAPAVRLTDEAIRRDPRNYEGWVALTDVLAKRHLAKATERALARVLALNPAFGQGPS